MEFWAGTIGGRNGRFAAVSRRSGGGRASDMPAKMILISGAVAFAVGDKVGFSFRGLFGILASPFLAPVRMNRP